jgi:hypothetical protein
VRRPVLFALLAALVFAPAAGAAARQRAIAAYAAAPGVIADRTLTTSRVDVPFGAWGGAITADTGEHLMVYASSHYAVDLALTQKWANYLASLVHGSEIGTLTTYLAPSGEITSFCGPGALACYAPGRNFLIASVEDVGNGLTPEAVVTHEYGHHIASHRSNPPWNAGNWGTKRWATYIGVCQKARHHLLFPGAEESLLYMLNPGEGFAEAYRLLNERRAGVPESAWDVVSPALYPDARALALLQEDVTNPWSGNSLTTATAALTRAKRVRTVSIATPLDGALRITVRAARGERVTVDATPFLMPVPTQMHGR